VYIEHAAYLNIGFWAFYGFFQGFASSLKTMCIAASVTRLVERAPAWGSGIGASSWRSSKCCVPKNKKEKREVISI